MTTAVIRTSDRKQFKRCRRHWGLSSGLRHNRTPIEQPSYFWLGTGGHFALEDYHGYNHYGHPVEAFRAYVKAQEIHCQKSRTRNIPDDYEEQAALCEAILDYYLTWLRHREPLQTYWVNGEPQVEVKVQVEIPLDLLPPEVQEWGYNRVLYDATLDKVVEIDGELWIVDYKFFQQFQQYNTLDFDQQISAYIWAASTIYDRPIAGAILHQFLKKIPNPPRILKNGSLSSAKNQGTTYYQYRDALIEIYGELEKAPSTHISCLNDLAAQENEDRDAYIWRAYTRRNQFQQEATGEKIIMEIGEMLNPNLPLYPNETKDCSWDCGMREICLMMDSGDDWKNTLEITTVNRTEEEESWRVHLP